ncbi:MAG: AAA family ATPase [Acidimicrobiales bacterium]|nr:AAA family ATPase [Acidimicrobiales bacterium]
MSETHISWVLFTPDRAFKILKPVTMPFLDLRTREARLAAVDREFELNRRLAPDVYLGVSDIVEHGEVVDRMLVMRRLPADRRLAALVGDDRFDDHLRRVARAVAIFHADAPPVDPAPMATRDALAALWEDNLTVLGDHVGAIIDAESHARLCDLTSAFLRGRDSLFAARAADGMVRDGHGDLLAEDIFCLDDGPRIIDCLAFDDDLRIGDVLLDIAFLVMDVERLAGREAGRRLLVWYQEFSNEHHPPSLAHHYVAYRASVRAKVACLRHDQGDDLSADLARRYTAMAVDHLERARVRMVLVGGGPGVGKSVLAHGLGDRYGATVLATDEIRKDLTGTPHDEHRFAAPGEGIYDDATSDQAYDEMLREATLLLRRGESVVLDATWAAERHRSSARSAARATVSDLAEIECVLDPAIAKERIAERLSNPWSPSDATPDLVDHHAQRRDPWAEAVQVDTAMVPAAVVAAALPAVDGRGPSGPDASTAHVGDTDADPRPARGGVEPGFEARLE